MCILAPSGEGVGIHAISLAWLPTSDKAGGAKGDVVSDDEEVEAKVGEWVILAGCSNGTIQEWTVASLSVSHSSYCASINNVNKSFESGRGPRRCFHVHSSKKSMKLTIVHLTCPTESDEASSRQLIEDTKQSASLVYMLVKGQGDEQSNESSWLASCSIPPFKGGNNHANQQHKLTLQLHTLATVKYAKAKSSDDKMGNYQKRHICFKKGEEIFGLVSVYRPKPCMEEDARMEYATDESEERHASGDLFVVICSSHGFAVYQDSVRRESKVEKEAVLPLVHFTRPIKCTQNTPQSKETSAFSSVAISPDINDLAFGRVSGHIDIIDNIFDSVTTFLEKVRKRNAQRAANGDSTDWSDSLQHPNMTTVRRIVHWHAHPVRALSFLTAYGRHKGSDRSLASSSLTKNLISGGEESVLATWQLDRNSHRPSHFVARVGQGGIIHTVCCQHSGKIIISCADNSIQCYSGSNYDRNWVEQGLASVPLHEEGPSAGEEPLNKGPIIVLKDPITSIPMMTNLPGAPGMIHWYDPKAASVVGILEVSYFDSSLCRTL